MATVTVVTDAFIELGREISAVLGSSDAVTSVIAHPLGDLAAAVVNTRSHAALPDILAKLRAVRSDPAQVPQESVQRLADVAGTWEHINDYFYRQGWTDGLPIVPPESWKVDAMIGACRHAAETVIGTVAPKMGIATVEKIAVNAVMAGCEPAYFPVVLAAVEAVCHPDFNLLAMQATTNPVTPMLIVNGPLARELDINSGCNVLGQGWKSNATIGRALRFVLNNIGGGVPGKLDRACHGQPGKFSLCIAENEAASPWEPYHVERGYAADESTVSVIGVAGTQDIIHYARTSARKVLDTLLHAIPREGHKNLYSGGEPLLIIGPEQAAILGKEGISKAALKQEIFDGTRVPVTLFNLETLELIRGRRPRCFAGSGAPAAIPIADQPQDIQIVVAGGAGNHSVFVPTWGDTRCVTAPTGRHVLAS